jgi:HSP20 family protein
MPQPWRFTEDRPPRTVWTLRRVSLGPARPLRGQRGVYEPPTDVYETPDRLVVRMEIAGLQPEELQVQLSTDRRLLTIAGQRRDPSSGSPRKFYTMEIECGEFARQIPIPVPVDEAAVSAAYAEGFLEISLPKLSPPVQRSRKVPID